ncbi:kinase subunit of RNA polymerase II carboxy-terminal domain kinase I [Allomyces arbusculus]|nr:kinase subunit of RNA polymerase II carboxy-terminal domain kinase I [Allomyces arbusculus]
MCPPRSTTPTLATTAVIPARAVPTPTAFSAIALAEPVLVAPITCTTAAVSVAARYAAFPPSRSPTPPPPMRMRSPPPSRRSRSPPPPPPMMRMRTPPPMMRPRSPAPMPVPIPIPMVIPPPPPVAAALDVLDVVMAPLPAPGELAATPAADPAYIVAPTPPTGPDYYETLAQVGEGTYGKVFRARHPKTGQLVALKRIRIEKDRDGFPITAVREMQLLQQVKHPNIIALNDVALETVANTGATESPTTTPAAAPMGQPQTYVYMVFEYMQHDLAGILQHPHVRFRAEHIKSLVQQLMQALAFLHARGIMHRDIKGSNMLLNRHGELKLADFGLARQVLSTAPSSHHHGETDTPVHGKPALEMTNRVITLWYRPIELLLGSTRYAPAIDLWSAGCILLELFLHRPAFPGTDELSQIEHVYKACGSPNVIDWPDVVDLQWFELVRPSAPKPRRLRDLFGAAFMLEPTASGSTAVPADHAIADGETPASAAAAFELVDALLQLNPAHRPSAAQALDHTYFRTAPRPIPPRSVLETLDDADHWHEFESKQRKRAAAVAAPAPTNDAGAASSPAHVVTSVRPPRSGKRTAMAAGPTAPSLRVSATVAHAASTLALARAAAALDAQQPPGLGGGGASRFAALALASAEGVPAPLVELALARCPTPPPEPEPEPMEVEPVVDVKMEEVCEAPLEQQRKESPRQHDPLSPRRNQPMPVDARETRLDATIQYPKSVEVTKVAHSPKSVDAAKLAASPKPLEPSKPVIMLGPSRPLELSMPLDTSIPDLMDIDDAEAVAAEMLLGLAKQARLSQTDLPAVHAPPANDTSTRPTEPTNGLPPLTSPVTSPSRQAPAPGDPASTGTIDATTTDATTTDVPATPAKPVKRRRIVRGTPAESMPVARVLPGPAAAEPVPPPPREATPPLTSPDAAAPALAAPPVETTPTTDANVTPPVVISPAPADPAAPEPAAPARRTSRRQAAARVQSYASLHAGVYDEGIFEARLPLSASSPPPAAKRARKATSCFGPPPASTPRARKKSADADGGDKPRARKKAAAEVVPPASGAPPGMPMEVVTVQPTPKKQPGRPRIRVVPGAPPPPPPTPAGVVVGNVDVPSTSAAAAAPVTAAVDPVKEEEGTPATSTVEEEVKVENV